MIYIFLLVYTLITSESSLSKPDIPCGIAYERELVNNHSKRIDLEPQYFFSFSHPEIKNFFKEDNLIKTYCQISKNEGVFSLNLNLVLSSSVAQKDYGIISNDSNLNIHFINGNYINLKCTKGSLGKVKEFQNSTVYALSYGLDKGHVKKLSKHDIDKVKVEWSSGVEEYEVFDVDAILDQMSCMKKLGFL